jgi:spermidine synthase
MPDRQRERARSAAPEPVKPFIHEGLDSKTMYFSVSAIQSRMDILRPDALVLEYTCTMMGFLIFKPRPARMAMIGLGGGSLAKFCHRHLPATDITVVEINPHVIALREAFRVPPEGPRFRVVADDGARFVGEASGRFDVLVVDAFDAEGMPAALGSARFYDNCLDLLSPGGLMVVNLHAGHPHFQVYLARIRGSFGQGVLCVEEADGCNSVVFAGKGDDVLKRVGHGGVRRPPSLSDEAWKQLQPAFSRIVRRLGAGEPG